MPTSEKDIVIGVLALQGAFQEHQECQEKGTGCKTIQASSNPLIVAAARSFMFLDHDRPQLYYYLIK